MNTPVLFTVALAASITLNFNPLPSGSRYQRPALTITQLGVVLTDDGARVYASLIASGIGGQIPLPLLLWGPETTPPYSSTPPGTGAGDTWTNATAQARVQALLGADAPTQTAAIKALFMPGQLAS